MFFCWWKLKTPMSPRLPDFPPFQDPPGLCAQSSMTFTPCRRPTAMMPSMSQHWPARCTGTMARVRGVISVSSRAGSMLSVRGSTSQNTTFAPSVENAKAVATQVTGVVMTSVPGPTPAAMPARVRPVVAEVTARACFTPQYAAKASSNCLTFFPHDGRVGPENVHERRGFLEAVACAVRDLELVLDLRCFHDFRSPSSDARRTLSAGRDPR